MTKAQPLRVGFDLDGVILYNPTRIIRPIIAAFKNKVLRKKGLRFYYPQTGWEKLFWRICHWSSFIEAPGLKNLITLAQTGRIEAYVITGRFDYLKNDFYRWIRKISGDEFLKGYYHNEQNEQSHLFKEKMIKKLKLDIFVEDNWDIVNYLNLKSLCNNKYKKSSRRKTRILWIYNLFDQQIKYKDGYPTLKAAIEMIRTNCLL